MEYIDMRKNLECYVLRSYIYSKKDVIYGVYRGFNNKILPPNIYTLTECDSTYGYYSNEQIRFSSLSRAIHNETEDERVKIEEEIYRILKLKNPIYIYLIAQCYREHGIDAVLRRFSPKLCYKRPKKDKLDRLKKLINKYSEVSQNYHYKLTKNEKSILRRLNKKK